MGQNEARGFYKGRRGKDYLSPGQDKPPMIKSDSSTTTTLSSEKKVGGRNLVFVDSSKFFRININKMLMCSTLGNEQMTLAE